MRERVEQGALEVIQKARVVLAEQWPVLQRHAAGDLLQAQVLEELITSPLFYVNTDKLAEAATAIARDYAKRYSELHQERKAQFTNAIEEIKGRSDWALVPEDLRESVLVPLAQRACESLSLADGASRCSNCHSTVSEMESDIAALSFLKAQTVARVQELTTPPEVEGARHERVRVADFFVGPLDSESAIKEAVERLTDYLLKLSAEGVRIIVE
jgi:hypothetical protein